MMGESVLDKQGRAWMWSCVLCARLSRESTDVELCVKAESFVSSVFTCFICNRALPRGPAPSCLLVVANLFTVFPVKWLDADPTQHNGLFLMKLPKWSDFPEEGDMWAHDLGGFSPGKPRRGGESTATEERRHLLTLWTQEGKGSLSGEVSEFGDQDVGLSTPSAAPCLPACHRVLP
ncbi:uncharacterized protein LOC118238834 isoform X1 [Cricetulus griseus]|nr:uncharacterized protein LOC118238834 isoform X1 [Cricetulus griseus]